MHDTWIHLGHVGLGYRLSIRAWAPSTNAGEGLPHSERYLGCADLAGMKNRRFNQIAKRHQKKHESHTLHYDLDW